jgi:hypothetical protein
LGNQESGKTVTVKIDKTPPVTTMDATPPANAAGWNEGNVTVTITSIDNLSGIDHTDYNLDGANWAAYTGPVTITTEGVHALQYRSLDKAGNVEATHQSAVKIDKTPPVVTFSGNQGSYTVDQTVSITCTATDPPGANGQLGSGVASTTCQNVSAPAYTFPLGTTTLSATAVDVAGNTSKGSTSFTVQVTYASLCALGRQFVSNTGMCTVLDAGQRNEQLGVPQGKAGELNGYRQMVKVAQQSAFVTSDHAAILLRLVDAL